MYRIFIVGVAFLSVAACATQRAETDAASAQLSDCLARETVAVSLLPLDLETATAAVLARCDYAGVERRLAAQWGAFSEDYRRGLQRVDMAGSIRGRIALIRAQRAQAARPSSPSEPSH
jgi:hypothetical protein